MPKFRCEVKITAYCNVEVEAENHHEASLKAIDKCGKETPEKVLYKDCSTETVSVTEEKCSNE